MIPGFEDFTVDVSEGDIEAINIIAKALNCRVGLHHAITNQEARKAMYSFNGTNISDVKFRKYIQYIRAYNLCPRLCASSKGYWIAKDEKEFIKYREGYASRMRAMSFTLACMTHFDVVNNVTK